ncbi:MAG: thiamine pyrophosphate-binding protein [Gammaproteobacteria bacterium]
MVNSKYRSGGRLIVDCLKAQSVDRIFCVPGESYLPVLDALYDSGIQVVVAKHEGGAAMMAEADGKLTGRPGVCFVTRAPGSTNASSGVHVAQHDSTPLVLFVGQVARSMRGRGAFQEIDHCQFYRDMAKWVEEIQEVDRIPETMSRAWHAALNGKPGPVVLSIPEDVMLQDSTSIPGQMVNATAPAPAAHHVEQFIRLLGESRRPMLILGGSQWTVSSYTMIHEFAERWRIPVACSFRRQSLFDNLHPNYAGDVGLGINPKLKQSIQSSDLLILLGTRFSQNASQGFSLASIPQPKVKLVHVHPDINEIGRVYHPTLAINSTPEEFLNNTLSVFPANISRDVSEDHIAYREWSESPPSSPGKAKLSEIMLSLRSVLGNDSIITNGAGNYAIWVHRFHRYRSLHSQLAPTSGSMGYGLPAAIAAKLRFPEKEVICFAGDGCFQVTEQEFGTAVQYGANIIVILIDNGMYGTIRMHQELRYPGRASATNLLNPDFAELARTYGGHGETVMRSDEFASAFQACRKSGKPSLIHVKVDPDAVTPNVSLADIRSRDERHGKTASK